MQRTAVYMGDHTILTKLIYGPKIFLDTRDVSLVPHLILDGCWESWITTVFLSLLKPEMTVLDIGANCGYYSLLAAMIVGQNGTVHAFEPNPLHHANFHKSISVNGFSQIKLHKVALSNEPGELTLYVPGNNTASSSLIRSISAKQANTDSVVTEVRVPVVRLDEYLPNVRPNVVKIDIEGAEPYIMDSLFRVIQKSEDIKIIMEYAPSFWSGHRPELIFRRFIDSGFSIHVICHDSTLLSVDIEDLIQSEQYTGHYDLLLTRT